MRITVRAFLPDVDDETDQAISDLMKVFCGAVRYAFKRLLETENTGDIEKAVSAKYGLNIRQAKDAVEEARQIIASQKEILKLNHDNSIKKVNAIERILSQDNLSERKRKALLKKLEKRNKRQAYYKRFIDSRTIPPVVFGTKALFIKRCKGHITREEWQAARNSRVYSRGDKTKCGNPNLRVISENGQTFLEVSTLRRTDRNRAVKMRTPLYLPRKLSKKTGQINGHDYKNMVLDYLRTGEAYQVELIKKARGYYCHITLDETKINSYKPVYTGHNGLIGVDTNPDGFGLTVVSKDGNYKESTYLKQPELQYARSNRRENLCGELAKEIVEYARMHECGVAVEDLKFKDDKDVGRKFSRIKHQFIYSSLLSALETACIRNGVEVTKVKPQFTSKIGLYKYCCQYGLNVHNAAAMVIARRAYGYKERVPIVLKDKFVIYKDTFDKKTEWAQWAIINNQLKEKGGTGFWIQNRRQILGLAKK